MKGLKKAISLTLALVLCLSLLPGAALAASYTEIVLGKYDEVGSFYEGFAQVKQNNKWGFIDKTGKEVTSCKYDKVGDFHDGLALVRVGGLTSGKYGFIDATGREVIPCLYLNAFDFSEGLALVRNEQRQYGFIDKTGKEIIPCQYAYAHSFSEGLAAVELNGKWGFVDKTGKEVIPCKYDDVGSFSEGLAQVCIGDWNTGKWGFVDETGKEVVPCQYNDTGDFHEGLAAVQKVTEVNDYGEVTLAWGFIDTTGREVIPCQYYYIEDGFSNGLALVLDEYLQGGFIDTTGKEIIPYQYVYADNFSDGLAVVAVCDDYEGPWEHGFIDTTGKEVIPCQYFNARSFSEGFAAVEKVMEVHDDGGITAKWGFIDTTGKEVVPCQYAEVGSFSEGLAAVKLDGKWGFISVSAASGAVPTIVSTGNNPEQRGTANAQTQTVLVDGKVVEFQMYSLSGSGGVTNYIKLRDLAAVLNGTDAQFNVTWTKKDGVGLETGKAYTPNGTENKTAYTGPQEYQRGNPTTSVDGVAVALQSFALQNGAYTYYKLRDLGQALGFNVGYDKAAKMAFIETDKPYDGKDR